MTARRFQPYPPAYRIRAMLAAGAWALLLIAAADTAAQAPEATYRISQRASVSQNLGNAAVSLDYSRPLARDRVDLFGGVVHWGELWTPGANEATVLEVSEEVKLNGTEVPEGRWSMWIIPSQVGPWELVFDARDTLFHTQRPELTDDQIRFIVAVEEGAPHVEALVPTGRQRRRHPADELGDDTSFYYAHAVPPGDDGFGFPVGTLQEGAFMGALVIDPPGAAPPPDERVFLITRWGAPDEPLVGVSWKVMLNGLSWPFTERLDLTVGDTVRWRVINASLAHRGQPDRGTFRWHRHRGFRAGHELPRQHGP